MLQDMEFILNGLYQKYHEKNVIREKPNLIDKNPSLHNDTTYMVVQFNVLFLFSILIFYIFRLNIKKLNRISILRKQMKPRLQVIDCLTLKMITCFPSRNDPVWEIMIAVTFLLIEVLETVAVQAVDLTDYSMKILTRDPFYHDLHLVVHWILIYFWLISAITICLILRKRIWMITVWKGLLKEELFQRAALIQSFLTRNTQPKDFLIKQW